MSDAPAWVVAQANTLASLRGWTPFVAIQVGYSLTERSIERDLLPMARSFELAVAAWSPLGGGVLTGKYHRNGSSATTKSRRGQFVSSRMPKNTNAIIAATLEIAKRRHVSPAQIAIAWIVQRGINVFLILGSKTLEQFADNIGALDITLEAHEIQSLEEASKIDLGFLHDMLNRIRSAESGMPNVFGVDDRRMQLHEHAAF